MHARRRETFGFEIQWILQIHEVVEEVVELVYEELQIDGTNIVGRSIIAENQLNNPEFWI